METWIIWAIASLFTGGLYNFMFKIIAERGYSTKEVSFYSFGIASIISFFMLFFLNGFNFLRQELPYIIGLAFLNLAFYYSSIISRIEAMKNIDTVIFYPIYKTFGPIFVTCVGFLIFQETLTLKESVGIVLGICVPLLLITKSENRIQKNLKLGIILVVVTAVFGTLSAMTPKTISLYDFNLAFFVFVGFIFGALFSGVSLFLENKKEKTYHKRGIIKFSFLLGIMHYLAFTTFNYAMGGNFAIAFTINSFGILIPIILSIIFYGEHFNMKKGLVIALSIVSILLFI